MPHSAPQYIVKSGALHHLAIWHTVEMSVNSGCTVFAESSISKDIGYAGIMKSVFTEEHWKEECKTHTHTHIENQKMLFLTIEVVLGRNKTGGIVSSWKSFVIFTVNRTR